MAHLVKAVALVFVFALASDASAAEEVVPAGGSDPVQIVANQSEPMGTPSEWLLVLACVAITFCAGGYTFFIYLRRRDALSALADIEAQSDKWQSPHGFERGP